MLSCECRYLDGLVSSGLQDKGALKPCHGLIQCFPFDSSFVEEILRSHVFGRKEEVMLHTVVVNLHQQLGGGIFQQGTVHVEIEGQDDALILSQRESAVGRDA